MARKPLPSRGFTLLELILVILIIGILLAVVAPSLSGLSRSQRLDNAARTVAGMLKQARVYAAAEARPYRVVVDTEDNTIWLEVLTTEGFDRPESTVGRIIELHQSLAIELEGGDTEDDHLMIRVEPDGTGQLAQMTITRPQDGKQLAVACLSPTEPYTIGQAVSPEELERGADDVEYDR